MQDMVQVSAINNHGKTSFKATNAWALTRKFLQLI